MNRGCLFCPDENIMTMRRGGWWDRRRIWSLLTFGPTSKNRNESHDDDDIFSTWGSEACVNRNLDRWIGCVLHYYFKHVVKK